MKTANGKKSTDPFIHSFCGDEKIQARFWAKVRKTDTCWLWVGGIKSDSGYGSFSLSCYLKYVTVYAHRFSLISSSGLPQNSRMTVDHLCRTRSCVRPDHLQFVGIRENVLRGNTLPASNVLKTQCPSGHKYSKENTGFNKSPGCRDGRYCKECRRAFARKYYWAKKRAAV